jgi:hypothetical protein
VSRVLAVLAAVAMVAGALWVRGRIDDDDSGGGGGGGTRALVCAPEVAEACRAISDAVTVEDAAATAQGLLTAERFAADGWATPGPWPEMVDALRSSAGRPTLFDDGGEVVASSRMAVVAPPDLPQGWRAVGDAVGGGGLRLGWRDPTTGFGVLQVGAFAVGFFDGPRFATNDFDAAFRSYLEGIQEEATEARDPLERRLQQGVSFAEAVVTFSAEAEAVLEGAAPGRVGDLAPTYPEPVVAVDAVVVGDRAGDIGTELQERGWEGPSDPSGLPSAGVLAALWQEVSR